MALGDFRCFTAVRKSDKSLVPHFTLVEREHSLLSLDYSDKGIEIRDPLNTLLRFMEMSKNISAADGRLAYKNYYMRDIDEDVLAEAQKILAMDSHPIRDAAKAKVSTFFDKLLHSVPVYTKRHLELSGICKGILFKGRNINFKQAVEESALKPGLRLVAHECGDFCITQDEPFMVQRISKAAACYYVIIEEALMLAVVSELEGRSINSLYELYDC